MSIQIDYPLGLSGLSITANAFAKDGGDVVGTSLTLTENTNRKGYYSVSTSALSAGWYWMQFAVGGNGFDSRWVNVPASGTVVAGGIAPGSIDLVQLSPALKALQLRSYLLTTGITSPVSADLWNAAGFYNSSPYYQAFATGLFAWNNGSGWTISNAIGVNGSAWWTTSSGATVIGPYTAQGTATGVPNVVGHGNAVLAGFQPDQSLLSSAQVATVPTSGVLARITDVPTAVQNRQEMDANSSRLANLDAAISSRLAASAYTSPPSASTIAAATAAVMFVDGTANPLKVNSDHTVLSASGNVIIENYITVPPAVAAASQVASAITCLRGDTLRVALPAMGDLTSRTRLVMTVKVSVNDSDDQSVLQVMEGTGLTRLNGSGSVNPSHASLTVVDANTGAANLEIDASNTALLTAGDYVWDVQAYLSTGISTPINGSLSVVADVTRTVM